MYPHTHVFPNREHFSVNSFSLRNLSLLNNFQKLSAVSNTVRFYIFSEMLVLMKIAYYRDKQ